MDSFKELIKNTRQKKELSRFKFGKLVGVSAVTVWRWESGHNEPTDNVKEFWIKKIKDL